MSCWFLLGKKVDVFGFYCKKKNKKNIGL